MYAELFRGDNGKTTRSFYPDDDALMADIAGAYGTFLRELYVAGCRNVQFDDCTWGMFCDPWYQDFLAKAGLSLEAMEKQYLALNNQVLDAKPEDLNVTTHVCRGNYHSTWASQGGYETVAPVLFSREHVSAFYLEFDDERSGGFEPLRFVAPDKKVVLGLVTTKRPQLEDQAVLRSRISEASRYVPLERLCLSPQCGFASCEIGNKLTEEEQWAKLRLVRDVALSVWG
jgi:methionine synthase II (cobalamin-independent)